MTREGNKSSNGARQALYRKYRPRSLDEIVGQPQTTDILRRSLKQGKVSHAYLLTGPKGVGKTSIARILAHEINNLPYSDDTNLDIIEIDAASNTGVDDVRDLRERVRLAPVAAARKIYIIDEVHMMSKSAFNALLKTLEEPPAHVVFILATTDLRKVPATIISRTQHYAFYAISKADLAGQLKKIAGTEGINISDEAIEAIAARGDGSFRNSISLLDQLSGFADDKQGITLDLVQSTLGLAPAEAVDTLLTAVSNHDIPEVIKQLDSLEQQGIQPPVLADQLTHALRERLADQPESVALLDALLAVPGSPQPQLKLLVTLVKAAKPSAPKTAAVHATKPKQTIIEAPVIVVEKPAPIPIPPEDKPTLKPRPASSNVDLQISNFDWSKLLEHTKENQVALYSVLIKCDFVLEGATLTIYAGRKFNKTKLDEPKYQTYLYGSLEKLGIDGVQVVIIGTTKPLTDEKLARVADIMGGGEEVSLSEVEE